MFLDSLLKTTCWRCVVADHGGSLPQILGYALAAPGHEDGLRNGFHWTIL